jgi:hypothetical protein
MQRYRHSGLLVCCAAIMVAAMSTGCKRGGTNTPAAEMRSETPATPANEPMTVNGCLKAGTAADTYVLTAEAHAQGGLPAATYQLVGTEGVNLKEHVGERVEVKGIMEAQKRVDARSTTEAPKNAGEKPTGTTGTPAVSTETQLDIKRLNVNSIQKVADRCEK